MIAQRRAFMGAHQLRAEVYVHTASARPLFVSPVEQWAWGEWIRQRDEDGVDRQYRRCSGLLYAQLLRTLPASHLVDLRAALVQVHGESVVAKLEASIRPAVAA